MQVPMKNLNQKDIETQLENLQNALQNRQMTYDFLNHAFYRFLDENPEIKELYREFASGHPEETWDFHPETYVSPESVREAEDKKEQPDEVEERQQETEDRTIGLDNH